MLDKIRALIVEALGDGVTVEIKPVASGNVSSDFGAGVTTYLSVYTDREGDQAIYVDGKLEVHQVTIYATELARVADGRLVRMRSAVLDDSLRQWPENESELKDMIDGYQPGFDAGATVGAPHQDGLALRSQWNNEQGCFEDSFVEPEKEPGWQPGPNEWVRLQDGTVRQHIGYEIHGTRKYYRFAGISTRFELGTLEPWKPKVGDWVKVNKAANTSGGLFWVSPCMDCFDGAVVRISSFMFQEPLHFRADGVDGFVFSVDWVEPAVPPKEAPANPSETPNSSTDHFGYFDDIEGVWVYEPNPFEGRKTEPAKEPEYREPTYADLANGPVEVEVSDDDNDQSCWVKRMLYAVLPANVRVRFVCEFPVEKGSIHRWKHARIQAC